MKAYKTINYLCICLFTISAYGMEKDDKKSQQQETSLQRITTASANAKLIELLVILEEKLYTYFKISDFMWLGTSSAYGKYKTERDRDQEERTISTLKLRDPKTLNNEERELIKHEARDAKALADAHVRLAKPIVGTEFLIGQLIEMAIDYILFDKITFGSIDPKPFKYFCDAKKLKALLQRICKDYFSQEVVMPDKEELKRFLIEVSKKGMTFEFETSNPEQDWDLLEEGVQQKLQAKMTGTPVRSREFQAMLRQLIGQRFSIRPKDTTTIDWSTTDVSSFWFSLSSTTQQNIARRMNAIDYITKFHETLVETALMEVNRTVINIDALFEDAEAFYKSAATLDVSKAIDLLQIFRYLGLNVEDYINFQGLTICINTFLQGKPVPKELILSCMKFNRFFESNNNEQMQEELDQAAHGIIALLFDFGLNGEDRWLKVLRSLAFYTNAHKTQAKKRISPAIPSEAQLQETPSSVHTNLVSAIIGDNSQLLSSLLRLPSVGLNSLYATLLPAARLNSHLMDLLIQEITVREEDELFKRLVKSISTFMPLDLSLRGPGIRLSTIKGILELVTHAKVGDLARKLTEYRAGQAAGELKTLNSLAKITGAAMIQATCRLLAPQTTPLLQELMKVNPTVQHTSRSSAPSLLIRALPNPAKDFEATNNEERIMALAQGLSAEQISTIVQALLPFLNFEHFIDALTTVFRPTPAQEQEFRQALEAFTVTYSGNESNAINYVRSFAKVEGCLKEVHPLSTIPGITLGNIQKVLSVGTTSAALAAANVRVEEEKSLVNRLSNLANILTVLNVSPESEPDSTTATGRLLEEIRESAKASFGNLEDACAAARKHGANGLALFEKKEPAAANAKLLSVEQADALFTFIPTLASIPGRIKRNLLLRASYDPMLAALGQKTPTEIIDSLFPSLSEPDRDAFFRWAANNMYIEFLDILLQPSPNGWSINPETIESVLYDAALHRHIELVTKIISMATIGTEAREAMVYWSATQAFKEENPQARNQCAVLFNMLISKPGIEIPVIDHALVGALSCSQPDSPVTLEPLVPGCRGWEKVVAFAVKKRYKTVAAMLLKMDIKRDDLITDAHASALEEALRQPDQDLIWPFLETWQLSAEALAKVLLWSARYTNNDIAQLMLNQLEDGDPLNIQDEEGRTVMGLALEKNNYLLAKKLLQLTLIDADIEKIYCFAAAENDRDMLIRLEHKYLISQNTKEKAFEQAKAKNRVVILHHLLPAVPHKALELAAQMGYSDVVKKLLEEYFSLDQTQSMLKFEHIRTAFVTAALAGRIDIVRVLLSTKVNVATSPIGQASPLELARETKHTNVRLFLNSQKF